MWCTKRMTGTIWSSRCATKSFLKRKRSPWASSLRSSLGSLMSWKLFSPTFRGWDFHSLAPTPSADDRCSDFVRRLRLPSIAMMLGAISSTASENHCKPWVIEVDRWEIKTKWRKKASLALVYYSIPWVKLFNSIWVNSTHTLLISVLFSQLQTVQNHSSNCLLY